VCLGVFQAWFQDHIVIAASTDAEPDPGKLRIEKKNRKKFDGAYAHTVPLLHSPWSSSKNFCFRKFWRSYLDQNLLRITNPVSDLTGDH
jgi:hypothetical protein